MTGFCHIWIPNYGLKAKALSEALKGEERESLLIERATTSDSKDCVEQSISTETSKFGQALYPIHSQEIGDSTMSPDPKLGPHQRPVAYFSK